VNTTDELVASLEARIESLTHRIQVLQKDQELSVQVEKEAAIGRLARGVAHEINNPLQGVLGFVQLMIRSLKNGDLDRDLALDNLDRIESSALRCKRIVDALLDFSTREEGDPFPLDILGLLELNLVLFRNDLDLKKATIEVIGADRPVVVMGNPSQLARGLFNVMANARDAVLEGGHIRVEVTQDSSRVKISIFDDGPGISEENLTRIFDPFFSTKEVGEGTGLGLCAARGIFQSHGGDVRVHNVEQGGTRVDILLPLYAGPPDGTSP